MSTTINRFVRYFSAYSLICATIWDDLCVFYLINLYCSVLLFRRFALFFRSVMIPLRAELDSSCIAIVSLHSMCLGSANFVPVCDCVCVLNNKYINFYLFLFFF